MIQTIKKSGTMRAPGSAPVPATLPESWNEPLGDEPLVRDHNDDAPGISSLDNSAKPEFASPAGLVCANVGLERQIDAVIRRLQDDFPQIDPSNIRTLLNEALRQTHDARVQQFRSLLADRTVRDQLRPCSAQSRANAGAITGVGGDT